MGKILDLVQINIRGGREITCYCIYRWIHNFDFSKNFLFNKHLFVPSVSSALLCKVLWEMPKINIKGKNLGHKAL